MLRDLAPFPTSSRITFQRGLFFGLSRTATLTVTALLIFSSLSGAATVQHGPGRCSAWRNIIMTPNSTVQTDFNLTIIDVSYVAAGSNIPTPGSCQSTASSSTAMCRVQAVVQTTPTSAVHFETWLPDQWSGRFLAIWNGGLGGCIDYFYLDDGIKSGFATVSSDNGHDGNSGTVFLNNPEVINDFAFRAIHVMTELGKLIVRSYYRSPHTKSYYSGCSQGGRQGLQSALLYPDDFDGILAGSPATDMNNLFGWLGMLGRFVGAPTANPLISSAEWDLISREILNQCDGLDGVIDGIITDPDLCTFDPKTLLCSSSQSSSCLNGTQVAALQQIYSPLRGTHGQLLYPRYDPGAEADGQWMNTFSGDIIDLSLDWFRYAIFNDSSYSFENFGAADIEFANTINPGGIATWTGDFSAFRHRGGKVLTYHGRRDQIISSENSPRMYELVRSTLSLPTLDDFYRLFLIPGMEHCYLGPGAWNIGQGVPVAELNFPVPNDTEHNVLLALVKWVEHGHAPDVLVGTADTGTRRTHCRYPHASAFNGTKYVCEM